MPDGDSCSSFAFPLRRQAAGNRLHQTLTPASLASKDHDERLNQNNHLPPDGSAMKARFLTLLWVFLIQLAGIYLFTRGFLLMRLSLPNITAPSDSTDLSQLSTHGKAVVLIIDALRFDFVSPDTPEPASPYHHNVLTLPARLTKQRPQHSFIFNAYADPPTTTLQRIKGITTGSLPTFIDIGNNLGASSISEDSILVQLQKAGMRVR